MNNDFLKALRIVLPANLIFNDPDTLNNYAHDETEDFHFQPELVIKPKTSQDVSKALAVCYAHNIPVTPRGSGSGLAGGALPIKGGVVISMEHFNKILHIDEENLQVTTEPGVITEHLQDAVKAVGLYYPPDPASKAWSFIGGNISTNAGGPRAVKYGVTSTYVLNLEVVLPDGEIIWTGANTLKNSTGYNLTQLFVGSEGTLGIITKIVLRLIPHPTQQLLLLVPFESAEQACAAVAATFKAGITPSALEFMERAAIDRALTYLWETEQTKPKLPDSFLNDHVKAHLLIELDGFHIDSLYKDCEVLSNVLESFGCGEILFAEQEHDKNSLWQLRRCIGKATKHGNVYKEEDTVVPRASLPALLSGVKAIGSKYGFESVCYGHAGDGNLHVNILKGSLSDDFWHNELSQGIREIFELVKSLGGTISGEHGVGYVQRPYLDIVFTSRELALQKAIKQVFDPKGLMNPEKVVQ